MTHHLDKTTILTMPQGSPDWHRQRLGRITASRVGTILGHNPYETADELKEEMLSEMAGHPPSFTGNIFTHHGSISERHAARRYKSQLPSNMTVSHCGIVVSHHHPAYAFSPDGILEKAVRDGNGTILKSEPVGLLEIKCLIRKLPDAPDPVYFDQCQYGMYITGLPYADLYYLHHEQNLYLGDFYGRKTIHSKSYRIEESGDWRKESLPVLEKWLHELTREALVRGIELPEWLEK